MWIFAFFRQPRDVLDRAGEQPVAADAPLRSPALNRSVGGPTLFLGGIHP